ncbi:antitoxin VbhA family protein [Pseudomonas sp. BIGb0427]|uniref:antitoxin VbhA family protein n=1 Tax=Pseudomonas sp. BIGb0427 TaxID=2724470 RepID=UPI0016935442|nr:antitoxin VbhA family protein [Pseudomonas sp. BIGb0427]NLU58562.1 antitoxin VbhA family protein [Pseudomonas sp. BIGb0427]QPG63834.1 antitoxin VbhA family protein [Pseudomonas sp. BIGb0427]
MYMEIDGVERERRRKAVAAEIACLALDGVRIAAERFAQLQRYVDGQVSLEELRAELIEHLRLDDEGIADEDEMRRAWGDLE